MNTAYYNSLEHLSIQELRQEWVLWQQRSYLNSNNFRKEFDSAWNRFKPNKIMNRHQEAVAMVTLASDLVLYWEAMEEKSYD